jgi:hypothetical protein
MSDTAGRIARDAAALSVRVDAAATERELQDLQAEAVDAIYLHLHEEREVRAPLNAVYDRTVAALVALLGPDVCVGRVDVDLGTTFHEVWRSEFGVRPGSRTRAYVEAYLEGVRRRQDEGRRAA